MVTASRNHCFMRTSMARLIHCHRTVQAFLDVQRLRLMGDMARRQSAVASTFSGYFWVYRPFD
jgi:hypothetical protein